MADEIEIDMPSGGDFAADGLVAGDGSPIAVTDIPLGDMAPPQQHQEEERRGLLGEVGAPPVPPSAQPLWSIQYYQQFFDVDTEQVLSRIRSSVWPYKNNFLQRIKSRGDLYGPFWVSTTLIFAIAMAGNIANYRQSTDQQIWQYDFSKVTLAATTVYTYVTLVPFLAWLFLKWKCNEAPTLLEIFCLYGYSLFIFTPVSLLFVVLSNNLRWVLIAVSVALSGGVLATNFASVLSTQPKQQMLFTVSVVVGLHAALSVGFKFYFFNV